MAASRPAKTLHQERQKEFFERDPARVATLLFGNPKFPRTMRKKFTFIGSTFAGCGRILEVGTGRGFQLRWLLEMLGGRTQYVGVDIAYAPLVQARAGTEAADHQRVLLATGLAEALPFADSAFDGVFCLDVLHHAASQAAMLAEMTRVLRPGGRLLCVEPNPIYPVNLVYVRDPIERGLFQLTQRNATRWAQLAGLSEVRLDNLPIFFPGFPAAFAGVYERLERLLGWLPGVRRLSTTRVLTARRRP